MTVTCYRCRKAGRYSRLPCYYCDPVREPVRDAQYWDRYSQNLTIYLEDRQSQSPPRTPKEDP